MKSGVPLRAHLFKLLLNQRRRNLQGAKGATGANILGPPVSPGISRPIGKAEPYGAGGGGYLQIEGDTLRASFPDWGNTDGYPTNTPAAGYETGDLTHKANKSGFLDPPLTAGAVEAHDWSASNYNGYGFPDATLLKTHRAKGVMQTNMAGPTMFTSLDTPLAPSTTVTLWCLGHNAFQNNKQYLTVINASNHQLGFGIGSDANGFGNAQIRYYDGSTWYYGNLKQRQSGQTYLGANIPQCYKVVFTMANDSTAQGWFNGAALQDYQITDPDYPAEWPGWASFGAITSAYVVFSSTGTVYQYAFRAEFA